MAIKCLSIAKSFYLRRHSVSQDLILKLKKTINYLESVLLLLLKTAVIQQVAKFTQSLNYRCVKDYPIYDFDGYSVHLMSEIKQALLKRTLLCSCGYRRRE